MSGRVRAVLATTVATLLLAGVGGSVSASPAADAYGRQLFREAVASRHRAEVSALARNRCLQLAAVQHAVRMARNGQQLDPDRGAIRRECELKKVFAVVAGGFPNGRATVRGWLRDPRARQVVLHRRVVPAGAAARRTQDGTWFAVLLVGRVEPAR